MAEEFDNIVRHQTPEGRKPTEQAPRKSEKRLRILFAKMSNGCTLNEILRDEHGKPIDHVYIEANPAFEKLVGLRREDIVGWRMRDVLPDAESFWIEKYGHVALTREPAHFEGFLRAVDKYFDLHVFSPRMGQFAVVFVDITEQKRAERALRESEKKFRELADIAEAKLQVSEKLRRDLFERNPAGAFRTTLEGRMLDCNDALVRMFGYSSQEEILSLKVSDLYFEPRDRDALMRRLIEHKAALSEDIRFRRKDGSPVWLLVSLALIEQGDQPPVVQGTSVDTTAKKEAEEDLQSLLNISRTLTSTLDIYRLMDSLTIEAIKLTDAETACAGLRTPDGMVCSKLFHGSEPIPFEYCWPPGIGWPGWVLVRKVPYFTNDAQNDPVIVPENRNRFGVNAGICAPLINVHGEVNAFFNVNNKKGGAAFTNADLEKLMRVSEIASAALQNALAYQKLAETEESMRQLRNRLLQVKDEERRRIGRELHDVTGQALTALAMKLGVARRLLGVDEAKVREALGEALDITKKCSDDIRTLSYLLHSPVLEEGGLEAALRPYVQSFSQRSEIHTELDVPTQFGRLPGEIEVALFRVVQESLANIHLHSGGSSATIRFVQHPNEVILEIKDDGRGIPLEVLEKIRARTVMPGVGIASMQERIQQVGGRLDVSSDERGTLVRATVPLKAEES
jgi:PAS domain S-box-containing protein